MKRMPHSTDVILHPLISSFYIVSICTTTTTKEALLQLLVPIMALLCYCEGSLSNNRMRWDLFVRNQPK